MSTKEIVELLEDNLYEPNASEKISLKDFIDAIESVKCHGTYEDYEFTKESERIVDGRGDLCWGYYYTRVYYEPIKGTVISCSDATYDGYFNEYHYEGGLNQLVTKDGLTPPDSEYLKYYKCCSQDRPYFKEIKLENGIIIDSLLDIYFNGEIIISLIGLRNYWLANKNNEIGARVKVLLNAKTIDFNNLPYVYKKYFNPYDYNDMTR